jgi:hypothetical protein
MVPRKDPREQRGVGKHLLPERPGNGMHQRSKTSKNIGNRADRLRAGCANR